MAQQTFPGLKMAFRLVLLLLPPHISSQRPASPGKLSITSEPPGANITIDGQSQGTPTDSVFFVSPGDHSVAVTSASLPKCAAPVKVNVRSGSLTSINCTAAGWGNPTIK